MDANVFAISQKYPGLLKSLTFIFVIYCPSKLKLTQHMLLMPQSLSLEFGEVLRRNEKKMYENVSGLSKARGCMGVLNHFGT